MKHINNIIKSILFLLLLLNSKWACSQTYSLGVLIRPSYYHLENRFNRGEAGSLTKADKFTLDGGLRIGIQKERWLLSISSICQKRNIREECPFVNKLYPDSLHTILPGYQERDCDYRFTEKSKSLTILIRPSYIIKRTNKMTFYASGIIGSRLLLSLENKRVNLVNNSFRVSTRRNKTRFLTFGLSSGVQYKITKHLSLSSEFDLQLYEFSFTEYELNLNFGVLYSFTK